MAGWRAEARPTFRGRYGTEDMLKAMLLAFVFVFIASCSDGDWLRQYLPDGAQDAELVFARKTNFNIPSCSVAAYKPRITVELGTDFISDPIEDAVGEMSIIYGIIGTAADGCASPAEFGFSRDGYFDFISSPNIQYKWDRGNEVVIFDPASGLFWVLRADT